MDLSFIMLDPFVGFYEVTLNFFPWISRRVLQNGNKRKGGGGGGGGGCKYPLCCFQFLK